VVGCGCKMGIGFEASGFAASGAAGGEAGWSPVCWAKADDTIRRVARVPAIKKLCRVHEPVIIKNPPCSSTHGLCAD
jgi:hypothetical protein